MAKARQIVRRRKAVINIRKITRTMQLIATARFQQAYQRAIATKPYTEKISELVSELSRSAGDFDHPLLRDNPDAPADALIVITSNRGLCGSYNGQILRTAMENLKSRADREIALHVVGKKGIAYFKFFRRPMAAQIVNIDDRPRYEQVEPIATEMIAQYAAGQLGAVHVAYMKFLSAGRQVPEVTQLIPLRQATTTEEAVPAGPSVQYEFSPPPNVLLDKLLPQSVKVRLFQCFTDAAVSEQVSRMVAMKAATDAAEEMIKTLTRRYNRARQTQITLELLDIVSGAENLK
jgi:F-type H+-transporting ATPase subunit gamma